MSNSTHLRQVTLLWLAVVLPGWAADLAEPRAAIRIALSDNLFQNINENDARAAVKVWANALAASSHMEVATPELMHSDEIVHAIVNHSFDGFSIQIAEYVKVAPFVDRTLFTDEVSVREGLEYVVLVRKDKDISDLSSLRGRSIMVFQHPSMSLASQWLDVTLNGAKFDTADHFFGRVKICLKPSEAVLPVYFGAADACLISRRAFEMMSELNPQLRQKRQVIATSPKVVVGFFAIHKDATTETKNRIRQALLGYYDSPVGHQILTLFQAGRLIAVDNSLLRNSADIQTTYERIKARKVAGTK